MGRTKKLESLQVCRAIAAILVVIYHFSIESQTFLDHELLKSFFNFGHAGLNLFFVLSGFIIVYTHWEDIGGDIDTFKYYTFKRLTRIFPSYWPILLVVTAMYLLFGNYSKGVHESITFIMFIKNIFLISYDHETILSVAWTLQYEMLFYVFFSFFILSKHIAKILLIIWFSSIVLYNLYQTPLQSPFLKYLLNLNTIQFFIGCTVAYIIKKYNHYVIAPQLSLWTGMIGFICWGIHEDYYNNVSNMTNSMIYSTFSSLIILGLAHLETVKSIKCSSFLVFLGGASYAIYLTHSTLFSVLFRVVDYFPLRQIPLIRFYILFIFMLTTAIVIACIYYKYFEGPVLNLLKQKYKNKILVFTEQKC